MSKPQLRRADTPFPDVLTQEKANIRKRKSKKSPKEFLLFLISGGIGTALFYILYEFLFKVAPFEHYKSTIAWVVAYLCSIVWQMELHRRYISF